MSVAKLQAMKARIEEDKARAWRRVKDNRVNKRVYNYDINNKRTEKKVIESARVAKDWLKTLKSNQYVINMSAGAYHGVFLPMTTVWQEEEFFKEGKVTCRLIDVGVGVVGEKAMHGVDILFRITMEEEGEEDQEVTIHCFNMKAKVLVQSKGAIKFTNKVFEPKMMKSMKKSKDAIDCLNEEILKMAVEKRKRESTPMVGPKLKCEHCDKFFNNRGEITTHMRSKHFTRFESSFLPEDEEDVNASKPEMEEVSALNYEQDDETETVKEDDNADKAEIVFENIKPDTKIEKVNDNAVTPAAKVVDEMKPSKVDKISNVESMVKETLEDVLRDFKFGHPDEKNKNKSKPVGSDSKSEYPGKETVINHNVSKVDKEKVSNYEPLEPKILVIETINDEEDDEKKERTRKNNTNEDELKVLEIGKKRKNPVKPTVETVSSCSHMKEIDGFSCKRCQVMCSSMADLLHHVAEAHEEGSMTNFLIYNIAEDNKKIKEEMKNIQLALDFVLRDNQALQDLNLQTAVKLEAALCVIQKENVNVNVEEEEVQPKPTEEKEENIRFKPTTSRENEEEDWVVLDEYDSKQESVNVKKSESILWIGTSLSDQHLDAKKLSMKTNTNVKKVKAFTIFAEDGKYNPEKNVEDVANKELEKKAYDVVVIEVGVNEVSNLDLRKAPLLLKQEMNKKMERLHLMSVQMTMKYQGLRVVLVERVERIDSDQRANQAMWANQAMLSSWEANGKPENIILEKLNLKVKMREERDQVFGRLGERTWNGKFNDGIHLRGKDGSKEFTHRAGNMLMRVLGNKAKETRRQVDQKGSIENSKRDEIRMKENERRNADERRQADEKEKLSYEKKKEEEWRKVEEKRKRDEKWKMDEERSRYDEKRRWRDEKRKDESRRISIETKRAEEKRINSEKIRRQDIINRREEESKRRIRENNLREEKKRAQEERMRWSDQRQEHEREKRHDYEKRKLEREARHAKREEQEIEEKRFKKRKREKKDERLERMPAFRKTSNENSRNLNRHHAREREARRGEWRGSSYSRKEGRREETKEGFYYPRGEGRSEEISEGYYEAHYPPLPRAGNGRWGAPAPRHWA